MRIQADMYAVELGAALLLQFETPGGVVRVLADAGHEKYDVNSKLDGSISAFEGDKLRIDLMIGTHYDADHLDGLAAIIDNPAVEIGEAWLPPVANDTEFAPAASPETPLLALQFAQENGRDVLRRYLKVKAEDCGRLAELERRDDATRGIDRKEMDRRPDTHWRLQNFTAQYEALEPAREYFQAELADAAVTIGRRSLEEHSDQAIGDPWRGEAWVSEYGSREQWAEFTDRDGVFDRVRLDVEPQTLALIRESTAHEAINAASLARVVEALKRKKVKIRSATIEDGKPRTFGWVSASGPGGRFEPALPADPNAPTLILLGPSNALVEKFRHKLPIGSYLLAARMSAMAVETISPSNQLSYILVLEHQGQRILVSGDAGANDFMPGRSKPFYPELIAQLAPLNVVQVAHHGGANAYFYRVLLGSHFSRQPETVHFLLSHRTGDNKRPADSFCRFIADLNRSIADTTVLFTSKPLEARVRDIVRYVGPQVGLHADQGDLRLIYDGKAWGVQAHAITIP